MNKITILPHDGEHRTQDQAIAFHNERKEPMLSMPNIFQLVKENSTEAIGSLRKDFKDYWLVTSTRIVYDAKNLSAKIIHNAGSKFVKQKEISVREIPDYTSAELPDIINTDAGLIYCRALVDEPTATKEHITNFFVALAGKEADRIRFWTPSQSSRANRQVRSVVLCFVDLDRFGVNGDSWIVFNSGLSRGVAVKGSAKQTAKSEEGSDE